MHQLAWPKMRALPSDACCVALFARQCQIGIAYWSGASYSNPVHACETLRAGLPWKHCMAQRVHKEQGKHSHGSCSKLDQVGVRRTLEA